MKQQCTISKPENILECVPTTDFISRYLAAEFVFQLLASITFAPDLCKYLMVNTAFFIELVFRSISSSSSNVESNLTITTFPASSSLGNSPRVCTCGTASKFHQLEAWSYRIHKFLLRPQASYTQYLV